MIWIGKENLVNEEFVDFFHPKNTKNGKKEKEKKSESSGI
jgi:hypothetical protein